MKIDKKFWKSNGPVTVKWQNWDLTEQEAKIVEDLKVSSSRAFNHFIAAQRKASLACFAEALCLIIRKLTK
ncbi:MAG: hypothetical protein PHV42_04455 [Candidatus Pacebacteria bacterium]|nr:hypothetical protein [Candidatus Paceibacterota bacterium]